MYGEVFNDLSLFSDGVSEMRLPVSVLCEALSKVRQLAPEGQDLGGVDF